MSSSIQTEPKHGLRDTILSRPDIILDDQDVMQALVAANDRALGDNVVDMRGIAMGRLEARLEQLEETHRSVLAAAYENLAGTRMIHRAILQMLDATRLSDLLDGLAGPVAETLRVDGMRLLLETRGEDPVSHIPASGGVLGLTEQGYCCLYVGAGPTGAPRRVTLRRCEGTDPEMHGPESVRMRSEACLMFDLGPDRLPAMLAMGSVDPDQFAPGQATDLLEFFTSATERILRRLLP